MAENFVSIDLIILLRISVTMLFIVCVVYRRITISILYEDIESTASIISTYNQFNNSENVQNTRHSGHTSGKESACQCRSHRRLGFYAWVRQIPWRRNPLQYSSQDNPMNREAWWATVHGVAESDMIEQLTLSLLPNRTRNLFVAVT